VKTYQDRVVAAAARVDPRLLGGVWESVFGSGGGPVRAGGAAAAGQADGGGVGVGSAA